MPTLTKGIGLRLIGMSVNFACLLAMTQIFSLQKVGEITFVLNQKNALALILTFSSQVLLTKFVSGNLTGHAISFKNASYFLSFNFALLVLFGALFLGTDIPKAFLFIMILALTHAFLLLIEAMHRGHGGIIYSALFTRLLLPAALALSVF